MQFISEEIQKAKQRIKDVYEEAIGDNEYERRPAGSSDRANDEQKARNEFRDKIRERVEKNV